MASNLKTIEIDVRPIFIPSIPPDGGGENGGGEEQPEWLPEQSGEIRLIAGPTVAGHTSVINHVNPANSNPPNSFFGQQDPSPLWESRGGYTSGHAKIFAFSGLAGIGIRNGHIGLVYNGGGHADSGNQSVYFFDLVERRWYRVVDPLEVYQIGSVNNPETYPNITNFDATWGDYFAAVPHQPHTYCFNVMAENKLFMSQQAACGNLPYDFAGSHLVDLDIEAPEWARFSIITGNSRKGTAGFAAYDPVRKLVYRLALLGSGAQNVLDVFDLNPGASPQQYTRTLTDSVNCYIESSGVVHEASDLLLYGQSTGYSAGALRIQALALGDLDTGTEFTQLDVDGDAPVNLTRGDSAAMGIVYCPANESIYTVCETGFHRLSPPAGAVTAEDYLNGTWEWSHVEHAGPDILLTSFMYRAMCWDPVHEVFIGMERNVNGHVWAFKP